jgi:predicted HAD superfamily Cof-like phosphohydrolase
MKQPDSLNLVKEFHDTFKHPVLDAPQIPAANRCKLRISLLKEEVEELEEAIVKNDLVAVADAFADIQYVLSGAILEFGLGEKFAEIFNEVQRSNMSKACSTEEEAEKTIDYNTRKDGVTTESYYSVKDNDKWLVYRKSDNKTIKSVSYSPADIAKILN